MENWPPGLTRPASLAGITRSDLAAWPASRGRFMATRLVAYGAAVQLGADQPGMSEQVARPKCTVGHCGSGEVYILPPPENV